MSIFLSGKGFKEELLGRVSREKKVVEYFNEKRGERNLFPNIKSGHLEWDKLKRKGGHLEWDGGSIY